MKDINLLLEAEEVKAILDLLQKVARGNMVMIEVGSYQGASALQWVEFLKGLNGKLLCVDSWMLPEASFELFYEVMVSRGLWRTTVFALPMTSVMAASIINDISIDLIFIDANHSYSFIKQDIEAWLPKVRMGGIICGHDCEKRYDEYTEKQRDEIDRHLEDENTYFHCHPGVVKAVHEKFGETFQKVPKTRVWWKQVK